MIRLILNKIKANQILLLLIICLLVVLSSFGCSPRFQYLGADDIKTYGEDDIVEKLPRVYEEQRIFIPKPKVTRFSLGSFEGQGTTWDRNIEFFFETFLGFEYRISENRYFRDAEWKRIQEEAQYSFILSEIGGTYQDDRGLKIVYFQVRDREGTRSRVVYKSIRLITLQWVNIEGGDAYNYAKNHGFKFYHRFDGGDLDNNEDRCRISVIEAHGERQILQCEVRSSRFFGSRCDFYLFVNKKLNHGWNIKSHDTYRWPENNTENRGIEVIYASEDVQDIEFNIHGWKEAGGTDYPIYEIWSMVLEGPVGQDWHSAFD